MCGSKLNLRPKRCSPTSQEYSTSLLPLVFLRLLSTVMMGKENMANNEKLKRLVFSIGHAFDVQRKRKFPKHFLLWETVKHVFRSKQLTMIFRRHGDSESYEFGLELETALAKALEDVSIYRTDKIVTGGKPSIAL